MTANEAPDFATAVLGYRRWAVRDGRLLSPIHLHTWTPGINAATCDRRPNTPHDPPYKRCECGLYAWKRPHDWPGRRGFTWVYDRDLGFGKSGEKRGERLAVVGGAVALWGRLFVAETGVRAQYARILCLMPPCDPDVAAAYGVPLLDADAEFENVTTIPEFFAALEAKDRLKARRELEAA